MSAKSRITLSLPEVKELNVFFTEAMDDVQKRLQGKLKYVPRDQLTRIPTIFEDIQREKVLHIASIWSNHGIVENDDRNSPFHHLWVRQTPYVYPKQFLRIPYAEFAKGAETAYAIVGEYGVTWSEALLSSTLALFDAMRQLPHTKKGTKVQEDIIVAHTYQQDYVKVLYESVQTIGATAALLASQKVDGYADPMTLLQDVISSGLINRWALGLPFGYNAKLAFKAQRAYPRGLVEKNALTETDHRPVRFAKSVVPFFEAMREEFGRIEGAQRYHSNHGCPVGSKAPGYKETAIDMLGSLFMEQLSHYWTR